MKIKKVQTINVVFENKDTTPSNGTTKVRSSWYQDYGFTISNSLPWYMRGNDRQHGNSCGIFAFRNDSGGAFLYISYRIVLTP